MTSKKNTYCNKLLTVYHRFTHTLPILIEYAWSMARPWVEYGWSMARVCLEPRIAIFLLLFFMVGSGSVWGQTDYSGVYYIASVGYNAGNTANNYYLCPTEGWCYYKATDDFSPKTEDTGMPFLTTYKCRDGKYDATKAVWYVEKAPNSSYYYIKQASTGRYLTSNGTIRTTNNADRMRVHLETVAPENLGDKQLFTIAAYSTYLTISPKGVVGGAADRNWLTVNGGNNNNLTGQSGKTSGPTGYTNTAGIICIYTQSDANAPFYLETVSTATRPTITNNHDGTFTIATTTTGATIYYTTDGTTPTTATTTTGTTSVNVTQTEGMTDIKAIAKKDGDAFPSVVTTYIIPQCAKPTITISGGNVTINCATEGATIHYTTDGSPATSSSTVYDDPFAKGNATTIRAIAVKAGYIKSAEAIFLPSTEVSSSSQITDMNGNYLLADNFTLSASIGTASEPFTGTIDGNMVTLSGFDKALVAYANGATIKNVILDNVSISGGTYAGAICNEAAGDTRIYNCGVKSGTISGTNAGSIVGKLDGNARVINCYSFATVSGGTWGAGIVGYNSFSSTRSDLRTMVMNCMFYGEISSGNNISPIYGGLKITNVSNLNGYNYYRFDANYSRNNSITTYNCALAAEEKYLTRFEFFRNLLNSNRELAAWYATDNPSEGKGIGDECKMAKWVLDPADKPYPILKPQGYYPSVINYEDAPSLGTITLTINESNTTTGGATKPTGASINSNYPTTLTVYDKDLAHKHFNYRTVRLPYYNEVGTGNCTKNKVVTGWKITEFSGGTQGHFVKGVLDYSGTTHDEDEYPPYNFADSYCTDKDKYSVSGRVFSQGAYYDVPEGVTGITIEPYWGTAVYLSDPTYDVAYPTGYGNNNANAVFVSNMGDRYVGGDAASINGDNQTVYTTYSSAFGQVSSSGTVFDNAIVLVGNYHHYWGQNSPSTTKAFTIMSADLNNDCEPDYSFIVQHGTGRQDISSIRFDFINSPGLGMIQKVETDKAIPKHGIWCPKGWFEVTNTTLIQFTQFEYDRGGKPAGSPLILLGGIYDQFITARQNIANSTEYIHMGSNIWMKEFCNGLHTAGSNSHTTRHIPISVTGGEFESFYLTGTFQPNVNSVTDNAECYINGGKFGDMAGAGQEQLKGDVTWLIDHADITNFYGGGINGQKPVTGNIYVEINNSQVGLYCGGPKFGNMQNDKKVTTKAKGSTFGNFYGAGYGGTSYFRDMTKDITGKKDWDTWVGDYTREYVAGKGISTEYECEFIPYSGGQSGQADYVGRFYVLYASLSLAETKDVESTLEDCHITGSFYGGGKLGSVDGNITSTLKNCTVGESVYGAGFSASVEKVNVVPKGAKMNPNPGYNESVGVFTEGVYPDGVPYTWTHAASVSAGNEFDDTNHLIYTTTNLTDLGAVTGDATLNIEGTTTVGGSVYGGGEESVVNGNTSVTVTGGTIGTPGKGGATWGNVYGGGKGKEKDVQAGLVKGNATVSISGSPTILHNVYGGGAYGSVGTFTLDASDMPTALATANTGACNITIKGGTIGSNGDQNGMVFGSSRGDVAVPEGEPAVDPNDRTAWVYSTHVTIGDTEAETSPVIKGSVYGSGENGHTFQNTVVDIKKGTIGITTGETIGDYSGAAYPYRGNVYGGGCGTDTYWIDANSNSEVDDGEKHYNPLAGIVQGTATVNITGGHVVHNVYGAGAMGSVGGGAEANSGKTTINVTGGRIGHDGDGNGHVFGAARGEYGVSTAASGLANVRETVVNINYATTPAADNEDKNVQLIAGSVFGGGEAGTVKESVAVNMTGGLILKDVYGGGALADTQTSNWDATLNENAGGWAAGKTSASATTTVRLTGGRIGEEVFGGGLGEAGKPAYVWGDVLVDLNGTTPIDGTTHKPSTTGTATTNTSGCVVGQVFGCNNINGTPKGDVMVHVYATQNAAATQIANTPAVEASGNNPAVAAVTDAKVKGRYDVTAVYGGGNQAAYNPVTPYNGTSGSKTQVIIEGCSLTSINTVYGGGNAAAVPETNVVIKEAYEIGYLFGGGNGKDDIAPGVPNPGADVGTLDHGTTTYGTGNANTLMEGGLIHEAYGGSNTKGVIKGSINQITNPGDPEDPACCELEVEKIVGAGKYADIDGDVNMTLSCQPSKKVDLLFAGADEANVNGNITLNITNGHFGKVFGGNNLGGAIKGKITVNVEETGCQPIKIDDLYLGSNEAAYSVFGYYESEDIHSVTGKKILKPRTSADDTHTAVDNPATDDTHTFPYAQPELNIISCTYIGNVFGGGYGKGAVMYANPTVNVNMEPGQYANDEDKGVPAMMTQLGLDVTKTAPNPDKLGIIRNVFGGGDAADIAGNTYVNIATEANKGAYIIGSVFGGGNAADVLGNTNVTMSDGYVFNGIFGGGYAGSVGTFTRSTAAEDVNIYGHTAHEGCIGKPVSCAENTGKCTVVVNGGQIGPLSVATQGMNRPAAQGGPVPEGWVWGAGQGLIEDPAEYPDTHFKSYVGSTDVTIRGTALIMESIIGGGEFGRVLGNTLVKIEGGQIGIGEGKVDSDNKPIRYTDDQFVNPLTTTITNENALAECSHYPYGRDTNNDGKPDEFLPYDPYYEDYSDYVAAHTDLGPASTSNPSDGKTWIGCVFGGGSGYMPYKNASGYDWVRSAGWVEGNSEVRISGGHILTNVYGGNEVTDVKGKSIVKMTGGTIGVPRTLEQIAAHPVSCYLFGAGKGDDRPHFYNYTNVGSVEVEVSGGIIYGSVFGGSEDGHVTGDIKVDIKPGATIGTWGTSYIDGNVFGAGRGFSGNTLTAGNVGGNVTLNITGGNILGSVYGGGRLASVGTYLVPSNDANYGKLIPDNGNDKHGHITVNISGGTIGNNNEYFYNPSAAQKAAMPNTTFDYQNHLQYTKGGNVFTGGMGRLYALNNTTVLTSWQKLGQCKGTTLNMTGGTVKSSVYGGGEIGIVAQNATVNIDGGTVGTKVVDSGDATKNYYFGSVFGGGKGSTENIDGISMAGTTEGNVEVHLNKTVASNGAAKGAIVNQVFGCNDMNGSPKGTVTVYVYATQNAGQNNISTKPTKGTQTFDVEAVYGGGNLAAYEPEGGKNTTKSTKVIIDGCGLTSIKQVYGGGNAAATPATNVEINGTYEILELFGGGNGFDKLPDGRPNPGANVGYKNYTVYEKDGEDKWIAKDDPAYDTKEERTAGASAIVYGTGQASVNVFGGTIHRVFGGSNTKGNVRQTAVTLLDENNECDFCVDEAYGGGKSAPMDAEAKLLMACIPGLKAAYGGAEAAAIQGNVTLNITNGTFDRVFGGNNLSGTITGSITVNIEEIGCKPIIIGELYGGGNQAGYSVYGYNANGTPKETGTKLYDDPQINVKSFTSIGKVFGGGYGSGATMVGNPTVNVNEVYGRWYDNDISIVGENAKTSGNYPIPSHEKGKMGAISEIFGGGNAAKVIGSTTVNIATQEEVYLVKQVTAGAALPAGCYTRSGAGTTASPFVYTEATGNASASVTYYEKKDVLGVDIRGNVYGGGNNAEVTGNTDVVVGTTAATP